MPPTPDAMMVTEPQSGLRRFLGRFLAGTRDVFCHCSVPWQSRGVRAGRAPWFSRFRTSRTTIRAKSSFIIDYNCRRGV